MPPGPCKGSRGAFPFPLWGSAQFTRKAADSPAGQKAWGEIVKTVYFLGAGASAGSEFKLPTMKDFFQNFDSQAYPDLAHFLNDKFPNGDAASLNLEDVITHLELSLEGFGARWKPTGHDLLQARNDCLKFIQKQLNHIPAVISGPFNKHSEIYRAILGHSQKEDTFITLNYDLIFDYSINGFRNDKNSFFGDMFKDRLAHIIARPVFEVGGLDEILPGAVND